MPKVAPEHLENRRRQILAAANRCFARVGFHNATMQDVIKESGLSAGAIYNYFSSKEEIIIAIADERHIKEAAISKAAEIEAEPWDAIVHLARDFFGRLSDPGQDEERRVGVQLWAEALNNRKLLKVTMEGTAEPHRVLVKLIDRLKATGELPSEISSDAMARVMIALFQGLVLQKCREKDLDIEAFIDVTTFLTERLRMKNRRKPTAGSSRKTKGKGHASHRRDFRPLS